MPNDGLGRWTTQKEKVIDSAHFRNEGYSYWETDDESYKPKPSVCHDTSLTHMLTRRSTTGAELSISGYLCTGHIKPSASYGQRKRQWAIFIRTPSRAHLPEPSNRTRRARYACQGQ